MTLRPKEHWSQTPFVNPSKTPGRKMILKEKDWVVLCQAHFQLIKEEEWIERRETTKKNGVTSAGQRIAGEGGTLTEGSFPAKEEQVQAFHRRSALRESLMSVWRVDINQALRVCEERQAEVGASDGGTEWKTRGQAEPSRPLLKTEPS